MKKTQGVWVTDHVAHQDWGGLATAVHAKPVAGQEMFADKFPWKDNAWFEFWDPERRISAMIHTSTSFNGAPRATRAVLAHEGRVVTWDEVPNVGSLSSASINVDAAILPKGPASGAHRVSVSTPDMEFDLTLMPRWRPMDWTVLHMVPTLGEAPELNHLQQGFLAQGHVKLGGKRIEFNGGGFRDRTWGWRQESSQWRELYAVNAGLEKCDVSMCKFLLADGSAKIGGYIQDDQGIHEILTSELAYNREGQASQIRIDAEGLSTLVLDAGPTDAGWWLTFTKPNSKAPVWTEYHQLCSFDGGPSGKGYGAVPFSILRRLS